ncbi:MAG: CsbD family protein [Pseudomonas sp.]
MSSTKDKVKGKANEVVGRVKQASDKPGTRAEGGMQERKGEAQQLKGKVKDNLKDRIDKA